MSDRSKWPLVVGEQFTQAWINLKELPGGMMQSYSLERGHFRFGPIPATTSCGITTNPDDAQRWRDEGGPVMAVYAAHDVTSGAPPKMTEDQLAAVCLAVRHDHGLLSDERRAALRHEARVWEDAFRKVGVLPVGVALPDGAQR